MLENLKDKALKDIIDERLGEFCSAISTGETSGTHKITDNLWCFSGFSGGNGVSTLVRETAQMLKDQGLNVLVIDLNLNYPIHWISLGLEYGIHSKDIYDLALGTADLKDCILNGKISLLGCRGRSVIELNNLDTEVVMKNFDKILESLKLLYDVIVVDCPFGTFSNALINTALFKSDKTYMVWSDNYSNINNYKRVIDIFRLYGINIGRMRYIYNKRGSMYINEGVFKSLGIDAFISVLPYDKSVVECGLDGLSYVAKGSGTGENASLYYQGLLDLVKILLVEVSYDMDKTMLYDIKNFLGIKDIKGKEKKGLFGFGKKAKGNKVDTTEDGLTDDVIDEIILVDEEDDMEIKYED